MLHNLCVITPKRGLWSRGTQTFSPGGLNLTLYGGPRAKKTDLLLFIGSDPISIKCLTSEAKSVCKCSKSDD